MNMTIHPLSLQGYVVLFILEKSRNPRNRVRTPVFEAQTFCDDVPDSQLVERSIYVDRKIPTGP